MGDRPTIYDVAREAGVAASTVSRAYARPGRVNAETARAIFAAAERIGYRTGPITGTLGRQTGAVALMVSDITNPFYGEIIKGAAGGGPARPATRCCSPTPPRPARSSARSWSATLDLVEGIVLASSRMSDSAIRMIAKQKPLVLLNRQITETSCIVTDNPRGVRRAVEHLGKLGHDTITYVAGPEASWAEGMRWRALREAAHELELRVRRVDPCDDPTVRTGHAARAPDRRRAARRPCSPTTTRSRSASSRACKQLGVRVPGDVSVVGFDNVLLADIVDPALTTVAAPLRQAGALGVEQRPGHGRRGGASRRALVLPVRLVVRGSTGPAVSAAGTASRRRAARRACPGRPRTPPTSTDAGSR